MDVTDDGGIHAQAREGVQWTIVHDGRQTEISPWAADIGRVWEIFSFGTLDRGA